MAAATVATIGTIMRIQIQLRSVAGWGGSDRLIRKVLFGGGDDVPVQKVVWAQPHARTLPTQKTEAKVACKVINIMTGLGMPVSRRVA